MHPQLLRSFSGTKRYVLCAGNHGNSCGYFVGTGVWNEVVSSARHTILCPRSSGFLTEGSLRGTLRKELAERWQGGSGVGHQLKGLSSKAGGVYVTCHLPEEKSACHRSSNCRSESWCHLNPVKTFFSFVLSSCQYVVNYEHW